MIFRDATEADLPAIVALLADDALGATREQLADPLPEPYVTVFRALTAQQGNHLIVSCDDQHTVLACLQLVITPGIARMGATRATIEGVRVRADQRGTGLGKRLVEYAINEVRKAGCQIVQLTTDKQRPDAHRFYEALGFQPSHIGMKLILD